MTTKQQVTVTRNGKQYYAVSYDTQMAFGRECWAVREVGTVAGGANFPVGLDADFDARMKSARDAFRAEMAAKRAEDANAKSYRKLQNEGGEGFNPHD